MKRILYGNFRTFLMIAAAGAAILSSCRSTVVDDLSEEQANRILVALNASAIAARKASTPRADGKVVYRIETAPEEVPRALSILQAAELPSRPKTGFKELFGDVGILPTATEEKARYVAAISGELERSIETIDGVIDARVHVALADSCNAALDGPRPKTRASVLIKRRPNTRPLDPKDIRALVAGAAQDIDQADVTVVQLATTWSPATNLELVRIGPLTLTRDSAAFFKAMTATILLLNSILAIALVVLVAKLRRISSRSGID